MVTDRPRVACNLPVATGLIRRSRCCARSFIGLATEAFAQLIAIADTDNVARGGCGRYGISLAGPLGPSFATT